MLERFFGVRRKPPLTAHPLTRVLFTEREAMDRTVVVVGFKDREVHFRAPSNLKSLEDFTRERWRMKLPEIQNFVGFRLGNEPAFFGDVGDQEEIIRALTMLFRETGIEVSHAVGRILPPEVAFERRLVILSADPLTGQVRVATDNGSAKSWLFGQSEKTTLIRSLRAQTQMPDDRRISFEFINLTETQLGKLLDETYPGYIVGVVSDESVETFETDIRQQYAILQDGVTNAPGRAKTRQEEILDTILESALSQRATDIDINFKPTSETHGHLNFRFYYGGQWRQQPPIALPLAAYRAIMRTTFTMTGMSNPDFFGGPKEGTFKYTSSREGVLNFRIAAAPDTQARYPNLESYACTFRLLRPGAASMKLSQLGLLPDQLVPCQMAALAPFGLIVNAGRTGTGKGITQSALIQHLLAHDPAAMVRFLVNPQEYDIPGVFQTDTGYTSGGRSWTTEEYVRNILKRRPRAIAIPEVNDRDSAQMAMYCSTSGHLTLVTIHAETPFSVMSRFQTYGVPFDVFAEQARLITTQVLVPKLCSHCKLPVNEDHLAEYLKDPRLRYLPLVYQHWFQSDLGGKQIQEINLYRPKPGGCAHCNGIGYRGDLAVFEVLDPVESEIRDMMTEGIPMDRIRDAAIANGHLTMHAAGLSYVIDGVIDLLKFIDLADRLDPYREGVPVERIQEFKQARSNFGRKPGYKASKVTPEPADVVNPSDRSGDVLDIEFDVVPEVER